MTNLIMSNIIYILSFVAGLAFAQYETVSEFVVPIDNTNLYP